MIQIIYAFVHNPCFYESVAGVVSLHFKKPDAYRAMRRRKIDDYDQWYNERHRRGCLATCKYPEWERYGILKMVVR